MRQLPGRFRAARRQAAGRPIRLWVMDESPLGLHTELGRRITLRGIKPVGRYDFRRESFWLYGAGDVLTGEGYFARFGQLRATHFQQFLDELVAHYPHDYHVMVLDNAAAHRATSLRLPASLPLLFLPPYSPEFNPIERLWLHWKRQLAGHHFPSLYDLPCRLASLITATPTPLFHSLMAPPWLRHAASLSFLAP